MSIGKFVAIGAGWFFAGPIGAIIGYYIGKSFFDGKNDQANAYELSLLILYLTFINCSSFLNNKLQSSVINPLLLK